MKLKELVVAQIQGALMTKPNGMTASELVNHLIEHCGAPNDLTPAGIGLADADVIKLMR